MTRANARTDELIASVFAACNELSDALDRPISPDGHLVGGLGEVFARDALGLELTDPSMKDVDAHDADGQKVQIKATTRGSIALSGEDPGEADRLVVVRLDSQTGSASHVYDGPAAPVWNMHPKPLNRKQWTKSIRIIAELDDNELISDG